jgi:hypothetical protein
MGNSSQFKSQLEKISPPVSMIFGILSFLANASTLVGPKLYPLSPSITDIIWDYFMIFSLFYGGMFIFPIIGLILGILSRKSKLGTVGIILSAINLMGALYLGSVFFRIFQQ